MAIDLSDKYYKLGAGIVPRSYSVENVTPPEGIKHFELDGQEPLFARWDAKKAVCTLKDGDPKKPVLADNLINTDLLVIVSERLKNALEKQKVEDVEYLPVTLKDKKEFDVAYFIVHLLNLPDFLDLKASGATMSMLLKERVDEVKSLKFTKDPGRMLVRPSNYRDIYMIRKDLAEALSTEGFAGLRFSPLNINEDGNYTPEDIALVTQTEPLNKKNKAAEPISLTGEKPGKTPKRLDPASLDLAWIEKLDDKAIAARGYEVHDGKLVETFLPMEGDDVWLDAYNDDPDNWPAFDPKRYYCIGNNTQSNYWLIDLESKTGTVVYFAHDADYSEKNNFSKVAGSPAAFKKMVSLKKK